MEDRVKLTADDADYQRVMRRAGETADGFTNRINRASEGFQSLFKRTPGRRAQLALTGLASSIASGDIEGGLAQIAHRMTGLGLAAGVGIGVAAALFAKFHKQIEETEAAHEALRLEMVKHPLSNITSLSGEGMEHALQTRQKLVEDLQQKSEHTLGSELFAGLQGVNPKYAFGAVEESEKERLQTQLDINRATVEGKQIMLAHASLMERMVGIRQQELEGDSEIAAMAKATLETDQQRAALKGKNLSRAAFEIEDRALQDNLALQRRQIEEQHRSARARIAMETHLADFQNKHGDGIETKRERLKGEIGFLKQQIQDEGDPEKRGRLILERKEKENEEASLNKQKALKEAQLKMEERIAELQHRGPGTRYSTGTPLSGDDLKRVRAGLEIKNLDEQIASEKDPLAKRALQLERRQKANEAHDLLEPAIKNPFPYGTSASRDFERQFGYSGFARRGIEDSLGFGGLARASIERGESLTPEEALLKTGTSAADIAGFRKNVGDLPGEKSGDPALLGVMTEIRNIIEEAWAKE